MVCLVGGENDVKGLLTGAEHKKVGGGEKPSWARKWWRPRVSQVVNVEQLMITIISRLSMLKQARKARRMRILQGNAQNYYELVIVSSCIIQKNVILRYISSGLRVCFPFDVKSRSRKIGSCRGGSKHPRGSVARFCKTRQWFWTTGKPVTTKITDFQSFSEWSLTLCPLSLF